MCDKLTTELETESCSRCGGTGQYSFCQMYGTTCFKCRGAKRVYTKRGFAAKQYFEASCSVLATEIKVGDTVLCDFLGRSAFRKVDSINLEPSGQKIDGISVDYIKIQCDGHQMGVCPNTMVRKGFSNEDKKIKLEAAYQYQATLSKLGKPRKSK